MMHRHLVAGVLVVVSILAWGHATRAATYYWDINAGGAGAGGATPSGGWDGINTFWNTDSGGGPGTFVANPGTGDPLFVSAGADAIGVYTLTLTGTRSAASMTFEDGSPKLTGGALNLAAANRPDLFVNKNLVVNVPTAMDTPITVVGANSSNGLLIGGTNTLTLTKAISFDGMFGLADTVTLKLDPGGSLSQTGTVGNQIMWGDVGTTLLVNGGSYSSTGNNGPNTAFIGTLTVSSGSYSASGADPGQQHGINLYANGSTVNLDGGTSSVQSVKITGTNTAINFNGGALRTLAPTAAVSAFIPASANLTATVKLGGAVFDTNGVDTLVNQSLIHDAGLGLGLDGGLLKTGAGTLTLGGANTYNGVTTVNFGTLKAGTATSFGPAASASLAFGSASAGRVQLNGNNITVIGLNTHATPGTPLVESGSGTAGTDTLTVNNSTASTYAGVLQNGSTRLLALSKSGAATLTLKGANTYSGGTAVTQGTLNVGGGGATGSISTASVSVSSGATLAFDLSTGFSAAPLSVTGNLQYTSGAQLGLSGTYGANQITANGTNVSVNGSLVINAGAGGATFTGSSSTDAGITSSISRNITTTGNVTFTGTSTVASSFRSGIELAGAYTATSGTLTFDGTAAPTSSYGMENGRSGSFDGPISTFGNVTFKGTGGNGGSDFSHLSDLNLGNLTGNGTVTLIGRNKGLLRSSTFTASGGLPYNVVIQTTTGNVNGLLGAGTDTTGNGNYSVDSAGSIVLGGRTVNAGTGTISLKSTTGYSVTANSTLQAQSLSVIDSQNIAVSSGVTLTLNATGTINNVISGAGGRLTVSGGTITLTNTNTYSGPTTVSGGTLSLGTGGSIANSAVTVQSGAWLTGTGTTGPLTIAVGGTLSPGNSPGTTNTGDYVQNGNLIMEFLNHTGAAGVGYDTINVTGTVTLGASSNLAVNYTGAPLAFTPTFAQVFTLINNDGTGPGDTIGTFGNLPNEGDVVTVDGKQLKIYYHDGSTGDQNNIVLVSNSGSTAGATLYVNDQWTSGTVNGDQEIDSPAAFVGVNAFGSVSGSATSLLTAQPAFAGDVILNGGTYASALLAGGNGVTLQLVQDIAAPLPADVDVTIQNLSGDSNDGITLRFHNTANANLTVEQGSFAGIISGNGNLTKDTTGTLTLSGPNTYSGTTAVSAGVLNIQNATALGGTTNGTTVASGATLQVQGGITVGNESLNLSGVGAAGQNGALVNVSGTNNYGGLVTLGSATTISSDGGTLNLTHPGTITGATFGLTLTGAGDGSISSSIGTTSGTLTKNGSGTWTLTGASTYSGSTAVNNGTLELAAGGLQNSSIDVNVGTFLQSGGTNNVQGAAGVGNLNIASGAAYNLNDGILDFHDTDAASGHHTGGTLSQINLAGTGAFNFNGGTLRDVTEINTAGGTGTLVQNGGSFYIGQAEPDGDFPDNYARKTTIDGGYSLLAGTVYLDVFGDDTTPEECCDGVPSANDQLTVMGDVLLDSIISLNYVDGYEPVFGDAFTLLCASEPIALGDGFAIDGGFFRLIDTGNEEFPYALQAIVPEPASVAMWLMLGLAGVAGVWRSRQRIAGFRG